MLKNSESSGTKSFFHMHFLKGDEDKCAECKDVVQVDFREVEERLRQRETVFIMPKRMKRVSSNSATQKDVAQPWYFTHV